jgi:hypothetical protein
MKAVTKTLMILSITLTFTTGAMAAQSCPKAQGFNGGMTTRKQVEQKKDEKKPAEQKDAKPAG